MAFELPPDGSGPKRLRTSYVAGEVPVAAELAEDEIVLNAVDKRLFHKDRSGNVVPLDDLPTVTDLAYSATVTTNASLGTMFDLTLTGNVTLANPTNPVDGQTIRWRITQDGTGSRTVTLGAKFNIPSSASSPLPWSTAAGACDILACTYHEGRDQWDVVAFVPGY